MTMQWKIICEAILALLFAGAVIWLAGSSNTNAASAIVIAAAGGLVLSVRHYGWRKVAVSCGAGAVLIAAAWLALSFVVGVFAMAHHLLRHLSWQDEFGLVDALSVAIFIALGHLTFPWISRLWSWVRSELKT